MIFKKNFLTRITQNNNLRLGRRGDDHRNLVLMLAYRRLALLLRVDGPFVALFFMELLGRSHGMANKVEKMNLRRVRIEYNLSFCKNRLK